MQGFAGVPTLPACARHDLGDREWTVLEPLLPAGRSRGGRANGACGSWSTGSRDADLDRVRVAGRPGAVWPWQPVYGLFRRWQLDGTWAVIVLVLQALADDAGHVTWDVSVDSGTARAHQHAAGARKNPAAQKEPPGPEPGDHGLGRSRGGLTTKFHLAVYQGQKPLAVIVTAGQRGDSRSSSPCWRRSASRGCTAAEPAPGRTGSSGTKRRVARQPEVPAPPRDPLHHPREEGPAREPEEAGQLRRPPVRLRHGEVQAAARRGVRDQPAAAQPCRRHPLRQARRPLRGHPPRRRHRRVAPASHC